MLKMLQTVKEIKKEENSRIVSDGASTLVGCEVRGIMSAHGDTCPVRDDTAV